MVTLVSNILEIPEDIVHNPTLPYVIPQGKYAVIYPTASVSVTNIARSSGGEFSSRKLEVSKMEKVYALEGQSVDITPATLSPTGVTMAALDTIETINYPTMLTLDGVDSSLISNMSLTIVCEGEGSASTFTWSLSSEEFLTVVIYAKPINNLPDDLKE